MNKDTSNRGVLGFCLRLVEAVSRIVPDKWRGAWQQEWKSEIEYRSHKMQGWNRAGRKNEWRNQMKLFKRTLGAIADAAWLRQQFTFNLDFMQDIRFGLRQLRKNPGFTTVAVLTLALGIGATTAMFSIVNGVLLRPLPYPDSERIMRLYWKAGSGDVRQWHLPPFHFVYWREHSQVFDSVAGSIGASYNLAGTDAPQRVLGRRVSEDFFDVLQVYPALGRQFTPDEIQPGGPQVAVLGHDLWARAFDGNNGVLGNEFTLNDTPYTVIGVMPEDFVAYPGGTEIWTPLQLSINTASGLDTGGFNYEVMGRLKSGLTPAQANLELAGVADSFRRTYPALLADDQPGVGVMTYARSLTYYSQDFLLLLLGAVGFVLLIACANVANLILSRLTSRQQEMSIRRALGAGRLRLMRQWLVENLLLTMLGGAAGVLFGYWSLNLLVTTIPAGLPRLNEVGLDGAVLGFTLLVCIGTALAFGLVAVLHVTGTDPNEALRSGRQRDAGSPAGRKLAASLVVAQVALSLILVVGAALLISTVRNLFQQDTGFQTENLLGMQLRLTSRNYEATQSSWSFEQQLLARIQSMPGVVSATAASSLPLNRGLNTILELPRDGKQQIQLIEYRSVSPGYFETLGISMVQGRQFRDTDTATAQPVVIVNETLARLLDAGDDLRGRVIVIGKGLGPMQEPSRGIVGVMRNVRDRSLGDQSAPTAYVPRAQVPDAVNAQVHKWFPAAYLIRTAGPVNLFDSLNAAVLDLDPGQPVTQIRWMDQVLSDSLTWHRFRMQLIGLFAATALALTIVGVYGVLSYWVTRRTHEFGIRMALGALGRNVLAMVIREGLILASVGIAAGLAGSYFLTRYLENLLFGVTATDPLTFAGVSFLLLMAAALACYIPARRATKVDPMVALRYE